LNELRLIAVTGVWLVAVAGGMFSLTAYKSTPGGAAEPSVRWPSDSRLARAPGKATLIMAAHPRCTCTRASLHELSRLLDVAGRDVTAYVLFAKPSDDGDSEWTNSELWKRAQEIDGVTVVLDEDGVEAKRFDARVSGTVLLYDAGGRLLFDGGITPARGHEGDSFGRQRIITLLSGGTADRADSPTFGCALDDLGG
jgi:hypothetical protein